MIISVDTGNKHMKTENCEFNSGVEILDTLPGELEEVIEYEVKYYKTTNRRISYMEDKTADDRYYILTLFAIAKELSYRKKNEGLLPQNLQEIELLVGLPPAHYGKQRKKFREYFFRNGAVVEFCYKGISYEIYDSMEEFLEKSGWKRDNPELGEKSYLLDNHICRYIQGKVWYFSRLRYENQM